jgi:pimeloyl-ACP methyl ester carboxylesterase
MLARDPAAASHGHDPAPRQSHGLRRVPPAGHRLGGRRRLGVVPPIVALTLALAGCGVWRPVTVPMPALHDAAPCPGPVDTLLVMLPGAYSRPEEFVREGIVDAVRRAGIAADIVVADAHLGYYADRSVVDRLQADIIGLARARGYRQVWLVGISVGAFGALIYREQQLPDVAGIVALAPYLGARRVTAQIRADGGLTTWQAPAGELDREEIDLIVWRSLQRLTGAVPVPLYLGFGLDDRFRPDGELLAAALPPAHVFRAPGGHDWPAWRALWQQMVEVLPLRRDAACRQPANARPD